MADLTSNLIVRLIDKVSGPASAAGRAIRGMRQSVAGAGGAIAAAQANVRTALDANTQRMDAMRGRMFDAAAGAYVLTRALAAPIQAAMDFESAMADVRKVVDFDTPAAFKQFGGDVIAMSKRIAMSSTGLASIVASAGQAGIPRDELLRFTEMAAKVGIAFDISAEQAGDSLAKMMTGLGLTITEVSALSDAMNHLSNSQASSAADILDVVRRVGATAKQYGFSAEQVSAFASAMLSAGAESNVAATSFRNMGQALTKGASATKAQRGAFAQLGLKAEDVALRMQRDAVGTTMDVLERLGRLPKEMQAAVSSDLFGDEARALGPLLTNLDLLRKSLGLLADKSKYLGSAQKEYDSRAKTSANAFQLFKNNIEALSIAIGNTLIPGLNKLFSAVTPIINAFETLATDFPGVTSGIISLVTGLVGLRIAALGAGYAGLLLRGGFLTAILPALGLAKGVTRVGAALGRAVPRVRLFGKAMKAVPEATAATAAGMSLVDQSMTKAVKASKKASDAMVLGMSATRVAQAQASRSMIAGMSAVTAASVVPRRGLVGAFRGIGTAAAAAIAAPVAAALQGLPAIARVAAKGIKIALLGTGIGAALLVIGAAAEWVRENWEGITVGVEAFAGEFNRSMKAAFPDGEPDFVKFIRDLVQTFDELTGKIDPENGKWAQWGIAAAKSAAEWVTEINKITSAFDGLGTAIGDFYRLYQDFAALVPGFTIVGLAIETFQSLGRSANNVANYFSGVTDAARAATAEFYTVGSRWVQSLWDGMVAKIGELVAWAAGIPGMIIAAIGSIDLSNIIKWPTPPAWLGGAIGAGKAAPSVSGASELPEARAKGGPVTGGRPYIVGEKRPELFVPSSSGTIRPKVPGGGFTYAPQVSLTVHEAAGDVRTAFAEFNRRLREDAEAAFRAHFGDDMETA